MNALLNAPLNASGDRAPFRPFTRALTTPAGWPWDQTRAATLEAQHTSPVSGSGVVILVRRLKPWAFGQAGSFVAIYLRNGDGKSGEAFDIEIHGKTLRIELPSRAAREAAVIEYTWRLGAGLVIALALVGLTLLALQRRSALEDRLTTAEVRLERSSHQARAIGRAKADAQSLEALDVKRQGLDQVLGDLRSVSLNKDTNARIDAFYWRKGYWAVEAHGDAPPVRGSVGGADIDLQRSVKPVRRDVWLWAGKSAGARQ